MEHVFELYFNTSLNRIKFYFIIVFYSIEEPYILIRTVCFIILLDFDTLSFKSFKHKTKIINQFGNYITMENEIST